MSKSIDLGQLQDSVEKARTRFASAQAALDRAQLVRDAALAAKDKAERALANGFQTVKG